MTGPVASAAAASLAPGTTVEVASRFRFLRARDRFNLEWRACFLFCLALLRTYDAWFGSDSVQSVVVGLIDCCVWGVGLSAATTKDQAGTPFIMGRRQRDGREGETCQPRISAFTALVWRPDAWQFTFLDGSWGLACLKTRAPSAHHHACRMMGGTFEKRGRSYLQFGRLRCVERACVRQVASEAIAMGLLSRPNAASSAEAAWKAMWPFPMPAQRGATITQAGSIRKRSGPSSGASTHMCS